MWFTHFLMNYNKSPSAFTCRDFFKSCCTQQPKPKISLESSLFLFSLALWLQLRKCWPWEWNHLNMTVIFGTTVSLKLVSSTSFRRRHCKLNTQRYSNPVPELNNSFLFWSVCDVLKPLWGEPMLRCFLGLVWCVRKSVGCDETVSCAPDRANEALWGL